MKRVLIGAALLVFALTIILPLLWVLVSSLKTGDAIVGSPWALPTSMHWVNYGNA